MKKILASLLIVAAAVTAASGQVTIAALNSAYTQNFDSLNTAGTWTNNSTLLGWYARTTATASITSFALNTGSNTTAGLYSYGVEGVNPLSDRALGFQTTNAFTGTAGSGQNFLGLRLSNTSGATATGFQLSYTGEQWRRESSGNQQSLVVQYAFGATSVMDTGVTWTTIPSLGFTSPVWESTAGGVALDGNAAGNSAALSASVAAPWAAGTELWIRWVDLNDALNDHVLAIDNVSFTAIPEPSTYAALFGALALAGVIAHRRRRSC